MKHFGLASIVAKDPLGRDHEPASTHIYDS